MYLPRRVHRECMRHKGCARHFMLDFIFLLGSSRLRRCWNWNVEDERRRGAIRHATVNAAKTAKVIAFPAPAVMAMAAAA